MFHRHRSVRQTNEVKVPRSGVRTASPGATPDGVIVSRLTDEHSANNGDLQALHHPRQHRFALRERQQVFKYQVGHRCHGFNGAAGEVGGDHHVITR